MRHAALMPQKPIKQWEFWPVFSSIENPSLVRWLQKALKIAQVDLGVQDFFTSNSSKGD
jgi:hypothetical protein